MHSKGKAANRKRRSLPSAFPVTRARRRVHGAVRLLYRQVSGHGSGAESSRQHGFVRRPTAKLWWGRSRTMPLLVAICALTIISCQIGLVSILKSTLYQVVPTDTSTYTQSSTRPQFIWFVTLGVHELLGTSEDPWTLPPPVLFLLCSWVVDYVASGEGA